VLVSIVTTPDEHLLEEVCLQRSKVISMVPEVKRNLAIQAFDEVVFEVLRGDYNGPIEIAPDDVRGATLGGGMFSTEVMTPKGARLLKRLFEAGMIPQRRKSSPKETPELDAYIGSEPELRRRSKEMRDERASAKAARDAAWQTMDDRAKYLAAHPAEALPAEITTSLIDRVFIHARGHGSGGTMTLGGLTCHKELDRYVSNSGKKRSTSVRIYWEDAEGKLHGDSREPPRLNRRSDPARNWGLGRE
jgi:hypothetical protein